MIAGRLGGRRLRAPKGAGTRPTTDRVREALFSRVESLMDLTDTRVLDLYAGSGALAFEALSRGATRAVLVESDRRATALITANADELGVGSQTTVRGDLVERALERGPAGEEFDLVLIDPPYPLGEPEIARVLAGLVDHGWLAPDALVVLERSARSPDPAWPEGLVSLESRTYGETTVHLAEPSSDSA
nr:16S rRNA (guanine(966)-N(2))-methyltransferase RsmD [Ornithinimicrobium cryptoxanthini]